MVYLLFLRTSESTTISLCQSRGIQPGSERFDHRVRTFWVIHLIMFIGAWASRICYWHRQWIIILRIFEFEPMLLLEITHVLFSNSNCSILPSEPMFRVGIMHRYCVWCWQLRLIISWYAHKKHFCSSSHWYSSISTVRWESAWHNTISRLLLWWPVLLWWLVLVVMAGIGCGGWY